MIESCEDWSCHCSDVPTTMSVCLKIEQSQFQWIMFIIIIITMRVLIVAMVMTENRCCYSNYIISILAILNVNNKTMTVIILIMSITITITISMLYIYITVIIIPLQNGWTNSQSSYGNITLAPTCSRWQLAVIRDACSARSKSFRAWQRWKSSGADHTQ